MLKLIIKECKAIVRLGKIFIKRSMIMLPMIVSFLILAIVAGMLGFTGVEIISIEIARVLFIIFIVLFLFSLIMHLVGYGRPPRV